MSCWMPCCSCRAQCDRHSAPVWNASAHGSARLLSAFAGRASWSRAHQAPCQVPVKPAAGATGLPTLASVRLQRRESRCDELFGLAQRELSEKAQADLDADLGGILTAAMRQLIDGRQEIGRRGHDSAARRAHVSFGEDVAAKVDQRVGFFDLLRYATTTHHSLDSYGGPHLGGPCPTCA